MKRVLGTLVLLLVTTNVRAQELPELPRPQFDWVGRGVLYSGAVADYWTTRQAIQHGAVEGNALALKGRYGQAALSVGYAVGFDLAASAMERKGHSDVAKMFRTMMGTIKWGIAAHNIGVTRQQIRNGR